MNHTSELHNKHIPYSAFTEVSNSKASYYIQVRKRHNYLITTGFNFNTVRA